MLLQKRERASPTVGVGTPLVWLSAWCPIAPRRERNTVQQPNKEPGRVDRWMVRAVRYLREWRRRHGRTVHNQMIRGASYTVGSGAVSLIIVWWQNRH